MTTQILTHAAVVAVMTSLLYDESLNITTEEDIPSDAVIISGIMNRFVFDPGKVVESKTKIKELLDELPGEFHVQGGGGGWSFLAACEDKHGHHWAEHRTMDMLFVIGQAAGYVKLLMPREMWPILPGGMPYYAVDTVNAFAV